MLIMFFKILHIKSLLLVLLLYSNNVMAATNIETVKDLRELKKQAESNNLPVLLMFTAEDCDYCEALRKHYLVPMVESGEYSSIILIRQLYIDDYSYLRNAKGELISGDSVALKYDVEVTPTLLFVNSEMKEVAERIVGLSDFNYFDETLKNHINKAKHFLANKSSVETEY